VLLAGPCHHYKPHVITTYECWQVAAAYSRSTAGQTRPRHRLGNTSPDVWVYPLEDERSGTSAYPKHLREPTVGTVLEATCGVPDGVHHALLPYLARRASARCENCMMNHRAEARRQAAPEARTKPRSLSGGCGPHRRILRATFDLESSAAVPAGYG
jgi:hypothetical protein